jgi:hypothetical protein
MELFVIAAAAITLVAVVVPALGYCLWCTVDALEESA